MFRSRTTRFLLPLGALITCAALVLPVSGDMPPQVTVPRTPPQLNSAPLFAVAGQAREVQAAVAGAPDVVVLNVRNAATGAAVAYAMRRVSDGLFSGTIPSDEVVGDELSYAVASRYGDVTRTSATGRLVPLQDVKTSSVELLSTAGRTVATLGLGSADTQLGTRGGREAALEYPPSFLYDAGNDAVVVLDAVKSRIVSADAAGIRDVTNLSGVSSTLSDIVRGADGALLVVDQARDQVVELAAGVQHAFSGIGIVARAIGSELAYAPNTDTVYLEDPTQGRFVPLLTHDRTTTSRERSANTADGLPTRIGSLAAEVDATSVVFGLDAGRNTGHRVTFADQVLDASEVLVDGSGVIWGLVSVAKPKDNAATTYLVRVDPIAETAKAVAIGALVGDVTRRLTAAPTGVVLMEEAANALRFVRYESL